MKEEVVEKTKVRTVQKKIMKVKVKEEAEFSFKKEFKMINKKIKKNITWSNLKKKNLKNIKSKNKQKQNMNKSQKAKKLNKNIGQKLKR